MKRYFAILALGAYGLTAHAGGIAFKERYVGLNPITKTKLNLTINENRSASFSTIDTLGQAENLRMSVKYRNNVETVFSLREEEDKGRLVAEIITTGDCQEVQTLVLKFPSGVFAHMTAQASARREEPPVNQRN